jgi:hypothetical protein
MIDYCNNIPRDIGKTDNILKYTNINFQLGNWSGAGASFYIKYEVVVHICKHIIDINSRECFCGMKYKYCNHNYSSNICTNCKHNNIECVYPDKSNYNIMEKILVSLNCDIHKIKKDCIDLIDIVLDNGFYPSHYNLINVDRADVNHYHIQYVQNYKPLIDYIIKCDINNITNNKPKNITKNITTLKTLLLIRKYCTFNLPFCVIKHNIIPYVYKI